jgi:hypothetical protein
MQSPMKTEVRNSYFYLGLYLQLGRSKHLTLHV